MSKKIWSRLKMMKCPDCNHAVIRNMLRNQYHCTKPCGFYMSSEAFNRVVENLYTGKPIVEDEVEKNQKELNNL